MSESLRCWVCTGAVAMAMAVGGRVHAQATVSSGKPMIMEARTSTALQKAMVPKGSVAIAKDQPITVIDGETTRGGGTATAPAAGTGAGAGAGATSTSSATRPRVRPSGTTASAEPRVLRVPLALEASSDSAELKTVRVVEGKGTIELIEGKPVLQQKSSGTTVLSSGLASSIAQDSTLSTETKTGLPWMVVDVKNDPLGTTPTPAPAVVRTARPFLLLAHAVQWVPSAQQYLAEFFVGLDPEANSAPGKLEEPFTANLSVSCDAVVPSSVRLDRIGPEGDHKVTVHCSPQVRTAGKQQLTVRIASGQLSYPFELPANPGPFALASSAAEVPGLGLSTVRLTVSQALEDGSPLPAKHDLEVPLQSETGELYPAALIIPSGKSAASAEVRVFGLGAMSVRAGLGPRTSSPLAIERVWPLVFLLITVLGGGTGGYLAILRRRIAKPHYARSMKRWARRISEGSLVGLVTVGVLLTTPSLAGLMPDIARGSELSWFSAAMLAGFLGVELIEKLAARFVPSEAPKPEPSA